MDTGSGSRRCPTFAEPAMHELSPNRRLRPSNACAPSAISSRLAGRLLPYRPDSCRPSTSSCSACRHRCTPPTSRMIADPDPLTPAACRQSGLPVVSLHAAMARQADTSHREYRRFLRRHSAGRRGGNHCPGGTANPLSGSPCCDGELGPFSRQDLANLLPLHGLTHLRAQLPAAPRRTSSTA